MQDRTKPIRVPGPDHPITITKNPNRVVVTFGDETVADTRNALILQEAAYPPVFYIPRRDANMALLRRTDHATYCPYKGDCSYFTLATGRREAPRAAWSYEYPFPAVVAIKDHLAFYHDRVDAIDERA